jgi:hypothetical protein
VQSLRYTSLRLHVSEANDEVVDRHELLQREMRHQEEDLQLLRSRSDALVMKDLRSRSSGINLLGTHWYR